VQTSATVFTLVPRRRLIGLSFGGMHSARRGTGTDVAGSRLYVPGDDVDAIDWAASAKLSCARGSDEFVVRESYAEEAPRVVVVCDHRPSMALHPPSLPWLHKPAAMALAAQIVVDSTLASRGYPGYVDVAESDPRWTPPRTQRTLPHLREPRPFTAPPDAIEQAIAHLELHRRVLPAGTFVFVLSDFLAPPPERTWLDALEHRWDVVPVVIQDPVWEQSFPDVAGVVVPLADPDTGAVVRVRLTRHEVDERRARNEERLATLLARFDALDMQPVLLSSDAADAMLDAFLDWAAWRVALKARPL
jgi:uncharacterized protein (DUF58 family)